MTKDLELETVGREAIGRHRQAIGRLPDMEAYFRSSGSLRVLYSFPYKIGGERISTTAWHQVVGAHESGALPRVHTGSVSRNLPDEIIVASTLALGPLRLPYRLLGRRGACRLHDVRVAKWLDRHPEKIDLVHAWPLAALNTIRVAKRHGIPVVLERINAHTRYAYQVVAEECEIIGVPLPEGHDHQFNSSSLSHEEAEYEEADFLLCPSDFVARTFVDQGFSPAKLLRHQYGFDERRFTPGNRGGSQGGLQMLYAGVCEPRKGLHYALEAWLGSGAQNEGTFRICGDFVRGYRERLEAMLSHPSVEVLGHRDDIPDLMRQSDLFVLPSVEEGSALVSYEARGSGCVLVVSDAAGAVCQDGENGLIHAARNVEALTSQLKSVEADRNMLGRLRDASLATRGELTWRAAGASLVAAYQKALEHRLT